MNDDQRFSQADYETLKHEVLFQGIFRLAKYTLRHRLFKGGWSHPIEREVFERSSAVAVLPYDPILDRVILIEQFRAGSLADPESPWLIEIPAGCMEPNESPTDVAYRECVEEASCQILSLTPIVKYFVSPGASNEFIHIFYGRVDASGIEGIHGLIEEEEDIRVVNISSDEAFKWMEQGKIKNAPALLGLMWLKIQKLQKRPLELDFGHF